MSIGDALELAGAVLILSVAAGLAITIVGAAVIALQRRRDR